MPQAVGGGCWHCLLLAGAIGVALSAKNPGFPTGFFVKMVIFSVYCAGNVI